MLVHLDTHHFRYRIHHREMQALTGIRQWMSNAAQLAVPLLTLANESTRAKQYGTSCPSALVDCLEPTISNLNEAAEKQRQLRVRVIEFSSTPKVIESSDHLEGS
jgi:hypothetical protein